MKQMLIISIWLMTWPCYGADDKLPYVRLPIPFSELINRYKSLSPNSLMARATAKALVCFVDRVDEIRSETLEEMDTHREILTKAVLEDLTEQLTQELGPRFKTTPPKKVNAVLAYYVVNLFAAREAAWEADSKASATWDSWRPDLDDTGRDPWHEAWEVTYKALWSVFLKDCTSPIIRTTLKTAQRHARSAAFGPCTRIAMKLSTNHKRTQILSSMANLIALRWCSGAEAQKLRDLIYQAHESHVHSTGVDLEATILAHIAKHELGGNPYIQQMKEVLKITSPAHIEITSPVSSCCVIQ